MLFPTLIPRARPSRTMLFAVCLLFSSCLGCCFDGASCATQSMPSVCDHPLRSDYSNFYSKQTMTVAAEVFAAGAIMANTNIDQHLRNSYQDDIRSDATDDVSAVAKIFGEGYLILPALGITLASAEMMDDDPRASVAGDWADQSLRAIAVGAPPVLATQVLTGGARPSDSSHGANWVPMHDNNGVSGHAFMGAVPFITAAKMTEDPLAKTGWYAASTLTGLSRINDDAHYSSQVLLGWSLAYLACTAVSDTEQELKDFRFTTVPVADGVGVGVVFEH